MRTYYQVKKKIILKVRRFPLEFSKERLIVWTHLLKLRQKKFDVIILLVSLIISITYIKDKVKSV